MSFSDVGLVSETLCRVEMYNRCLCHLETLRL